MRRQAEHWGAELFQEDVESVYIKNSPFTVKSSEHKELLQKGSGYLVKMSRGKVGELVLVQFVMEPHRCFKGQVLAVVGGGDTTTEESLYLTKYALHVHLLVRKDQLRASKAMQDRLQSSQKPSSCLAEGYLPSFPSLNLLDVDPSGWVGHMIVDHRECFRVFSNPNITMHFNTEAVDVVSNTKGRCLLLEGQVELDRTGYVLVDEGSAKTSVEGSTDDNIYGSKIIV
ncbi:hypothetical protein GH714_034128 [Hevea brasiliensis]|uniref:Pyridine nucleotide-disulphide oxidoreductase N-terminal domain-containing protein n=1 Tax=Hevea brasiliensis TaxID=3981 RepID=A0A6A6M2R8_HEVBR|nr:hypothetical protein GH714_034128 [Hevea brasiliensis]